MTMGMAPLGFSPIRGACRGLRRSVRSPEVTVQNWLVKVMVMIALSLSYLGIGVTVDRTEP